MNQIIEYSNSLKEKNLFNIKNSNSKISFFKLNKYSLQFFISFILAVISILVLLYHFYKKNEQEKISKQLLKNYTLTTLYQDNQFNQVEIENTSTIIENPFVIGMLCIDKINLNYPILSESNKELLKISLCRFAGPMPNEVGNLCIAGHNYVDNRFFSKLKQLSKNDLVEVYDLNGRKVIYTVFDKYEVDVNDLSCTNQDVGNQKIITLITCNNVNGKRTVVKATEKL